MIDYTLYDWFWVGIAVTAGSLVITSLVSISLAIIVGSIKSYLMRQRNKE